MDKLELLKHVLSPNYLRPETALWRTLDIIAMDGFEMKSPSLDLGCGDGVFSFLRAGGVFADDFDVYQTVRDDDFYSNDDIYNYYDDTFSANIAFPPNTSIDIAFDHKNNLLKKAMGLDFYKRAVQGDANTSLPIESNCIKSVFSNIIYWLNEPQKVFQEIYRILVPGGEVCCMLLTSDFNELRITNKQYPYYSDEMSTLMSLLDRGRTENFPSLFSKELWLEQIKRTGFSIKSATTHLSPLTIKTWDIGLRPLFPIFNDFMNRLDKDDHAEVKKQWVNTFSKFLYPLVLNDNTADGCCLCVVAKK